MSNLSPSHSSEEELPSMKELCNFRSKPSSFYSRAQVYPLRPMKKSINSCSICNSKYNNTTTLPFLLPSCGHTFCKGCLSKMSYKAMIRCSICSSMTYKKLKKLPVNYALLEACESRNKKPLCQEHNSEFMAFCVNDESLLCGKCTMAHRSHRIFLLTDPEIQKIANSKKNSLDHEEEELFSRQSIWNEKKAEFQEGLLELQALVRKHKTRFLENEKKMTEKIAFGCQACIKDLDDITASEIGNVRKKVRESIEKIDNRLKRIKEVRKAFQGMNVVQKILNTCSGEGVESELPPGLEFMEKIIEKMKGKIDYEQCIKEKKVVIN